jgi:carbon storage regulator CsrA
MHLCLRIDPKESNRFNMLVLSRKSQQSVIVGDTQGGQFLKVTVLGIVGGRVKLGFEVASDVPVHRSEIWERDKKNAIQESPTSEPVTRVD